MTKPARDGRDDPFFDWIRSRRDLDSVVDRICVQNNDAWIHLYSERNEKKRENGTVSQVIDHIMHLELKTFCAEPDYAQRDTFGLIDAMLRKASSRKGDNRRYAMKVPDTRRPGQIRRARWLGSHLLQMSGDRPENSKIMIWDRSFRPTQDQLAEILGFIRDPDNPTKFLDTRRHHKPPAKEVEPPLLRLVNRHEEEVPLCIAQSL